MRLPDLRQLVPGLAAALALSSLAIAAPEGPADAIASAVNDALQRGDDAVARIVDVPSERRTYVNTVGAIDDIEAQLEIDTNMILFMPYVSTDPAVRDAGQQAQIEIQNWLIDLSKNEALFGAVEAFANTTPTLEGEQSRYLEHTLRDYRRAGMALPAEQRNELKELQKEIARLELAFDTAIREDETRVPLMREELAGMSEEYLGSLKTAGDVYLVGMAYPEFLPIMDLCDDEITRKKVWIAYKRRGGQKNIDTLQQLLELRARAANMLGYAHAADYETEVRMSKNAQTVIDFYERLRPLVRKKALEDYEVLVGAKRSHTGDRNARLHPWDTSYYTKRVMREAYAVDSEKVREYFPLDAVTDGLFSITQSLYGLEYKDVTSGASSRGIEIWHDDVRLYEVWDTGTNELLGMFTIDLHPRDNKYGHAAQWGLRQHKVWSDGRVTKPLAALVCNFTKPTADKPSLMSHDEVETYFHEFGHCLHTILSTAHTWGFAGTGVERDFVEAPSQMFENWVWDRDVLRTFAKHYKTGEAFPDELLDGMIRAKFLGSGMLAERQFYYGMFDMRCHLDPTGGLDTTQLAHDLWDPAAENVELYEPVDNTYFHAAFGHLTGYQAGYYGYQWSLVFACDMFERFKDLGMLSPSAGMYYREKILARGGTMDGLDLVRDYLGREPDMGPYLKHLGLED